MPVAGFQQDCRRCARLAGFLDQIRLSHPHYHAGPVPPFGDPDPRLLIVGLAPGLHGANATGRPFTGDHAGILLYQSLYRFGFSDRPESRSADDGLRLTGCRITNAVKCVPPQNKPVGAEIRTCNSYLAEELRSLARVKVVLALGLVAHQAVLRALSARLAEYRFAHGAEWALPDGRTLLDSYHCSRYNTQTGRLTEAAFHQVFERARRILDQPDP